MAIVLAIIISIIFFAANAIYFIRNGRALPFYPEAEYENTCSIKKIS